MKKTLLIIGFLTLLLAGCSNNTLKNADASTEEQPDTSYTRDYSPNPQVTDDRSLLRVGQSVTDEKGEASLLAIKHVNETYEIGPIKLTIKDMKQIHLRPDYSLIDYFHVLTHEEEFDFVKVFVEIENTSEEQVNFGPIALLETNTGKSLNWEQDIYLEELNGVIDGKESKKGNIGFILENSSDLQWINVRTSDVFDHDEKKIANSQEFKIQF